MSGGGGEGSTTGGFPAGSSTSQLLISCQAPQPGPRMAPHTCQTSLSRSGGAVMTSEPVILGRLLRMTHSTTGP